MRTTLLLSLLPLSFSALVSCSSYGLSPKASVPSKLALCETLGSDGGCALGSTLAIAGGVSRISGSFAYQLKSSARFQGSCELLRAKDDGSAGERVALCEIKDFSLAGAGRHSLDIGWEAAGAPLAAGNYFVKAVLTSEDGIARESLSAFIVR